MPPNFMTNILARSKKFSCFRAFRRRRLSRDSDAAAANAINHSLSNKCWAKEQRTKGGDVISAILKALRGDQEERSIFY